ncbi:MAG TPA: hypothetical protein VM095_11285 [Pyrinomonadaceae bacterium]|nr:hypothetical protein [Pyrinomonadaceae bacterium]
MAKRIILIALFIAAALLTFSLGIFSHVTISFQWTKPRHSEPVRIHVSLAKERMNENFPDPNYHIYEISVENVSDRTIQGYALMYETSSGRGYPAPCCSCENQTLLPWETKIRSTAGL